jgi:DNA polymerase epsilon subunit 1
LAEFLGPEVVKGKGGLCCYFVISKYPQDRPVAERAIPTQIFDADMEVQRDFLFRWTKDDGLLSGDVDIRNILDWQYYFDRLSTQIQKMVCIPAVLQGISNPVPEIELPEWLQKKTFDMRYHRQQKLSSFFQFKPQTPQHFGFASTRKEDMSINMSIEKKEAI